MINNFMNAPVNATEHKKVELRKETLEKLEHVVEMLKTENPGEDVWIGIYELLDAVVDDELVRGDDLWNDISRDLGEPYSDFWGPDELIAGWYFGFVEFVPKDEARYKVLITGYSIDGGNQFVNMDSDNGDILFINEELAITYSKSEADKVIERLGGENGFLQLRKVKVEE